MSPRAVPASRHRCDRAAPGTGACRGSGEPPGALRLTFPTSAPRRAAPAARCGIGPHQRDPLGYVIGPAQPAARRLASEPGPENSRARTGCVSAPSGRTRRCLRARRATGDGTTDRGVRAGPGQGFPGEETATPQVDREARHNPVHAVPSVIATRLPAGKFRAPSRSSRSFMALQHKYFCKLRCKTSVT